VINAQRPTADRLATLRSTPELGGWPERSLQALLWQFDEVTLPAGRLIAVEGRPCSQFVVVLEGRLAASSASDGRRLLGPGDSFGWQAMWERGPNEASLTVESEARLLVMGHAQFRALKAESGARAA
jgi:CRP-like cAMP-binding protein